MSRCFTLHVSVSHPTCLSVVSPRHPCLGASPCMSQCLTRRITVVSHVSQRPTLHVSATPLHVSAFHPTCLSASPYMSQHPPHQSSPASAPLGVTFPSLLALLRARLRRARPGRPAADCGWGGWRRGVIRRTSGGSRGMGVIRRTSGGGSRGTGGQKNTGGDREVGYTPGYTFGEAQGRGGGGGAGDGGRGRARRTSEGTGI